MEGTDDIIKKITEGEEKLQKYNDAVKKDFEESMVKITEIKRLIELIRVKINEYVEITINYNRLIASKKEVESSLEAARQSGIVLQDNINANNEKIAEKDRKIAELTTQVQQQTGDLDASKTVKTQLEALLKEKKKLPANLTH